MQRAALSLRRKALSLLSISTSPWAPCAASSGVRARPFLLAMVGSLLLAGFPAAIQAAPWYSVIDLGDRPGGADLDVAGAINSAGQVDG
jgi:hypothetical protein